MNANKILGIVAGFAAGAAAGVAIGILYAPQKGLYTRRKLSQKSEEMMGNMKSKVEKKWQAINENFAERPQEEFKRSQYDA